jgi:hypothetical protein
VLTYYRTNCDRLLNYCFGKERIEKSFRENDMAKQPEFRKYLPLEAWFRDLPITENQIEMTFDQIEAILGTPLPNSAIKLKTWWTNVLPKIQSHRTAGLNNGWMVIESDQNSRWVKFVRARSLK